MADLMGNSNSSNGNGESADAQSLTLSEAHGGLGLSFTAKSDASEPVRELHDTMEEVRALFAELNLPQRKNLVGQEAIQDAEEQFVTTLLSEYTELRDLLRERVGQDVNEEEQ